VARSVTEVWIEDDRGKDDVAANKISGKNSNMKEFDMVRDKN